MRRSLTGILALAILTGLGAPEVAAGAGPDLILHDAVVLTMDPDAPHATALAITGDRIVAVGSDAEVLPLASAGTTVIDLDGRTVTPGFIDSHGHWIGDRALYGVSTPQDAIQTALEDGWTTGSSCSAVGATSSRIRSCTPMGSTDTPYGEGSPLGPR